MNEIAIDKNIPLGRVLSLLTKKYIGVLTRRMGHLDIERHYYPLVAVEKGGGNITQKELADILHTDKATMVRMVDYLEEHGMLTRQTNPDDRREQHLVLTDKAKKLMPEIKQGIREVNEAALAELTEAEQETFYTLIAKMTGSLANLPGNEITMEFKKVKK